MAEQIRSANIGLVRDDLTPRPVFDNVLHKIDWLGQMSERLAGRVKSFEARYQLINSIRYEAQRAGLDPQLVFAVIEVESNFNSQAVSSAGAIGLMQIMPFWVDVLGDGNSQILLNPFLNIRYGCLTLAHYLEIEKGDLTRALARYNGSLGRMTYPNKVFDKYRSNWRYVYRQAVAY